MVHFTLGARALTSALQHSCSSLPCSHDLGDTFSGQEYSHTEAPHMASGAGPSSRFCLASQPHSFHTSSRASPHACGPARTAAMALVPAWSWSRGQYSHQALPFASLSLRNHGSAHGPPMPLFSLASALRRPASGDSSDTSSADSSEGQDEQLQAPGGQGMTAGPRGGPAEPSSEEDSSSETPTGSDLEDSEVEALKGVQCSGCRRPLLSRGLGELRVCDGCHRCFHRRCCKGGTYSRSHTSAAREEGAEGEAGGKVPAGREGEGEGDGADVGRGAGVGGSVKGGARGTAARRRGAAADKEEEEEEEDDGEDELWFHTHNCKGVHKGLQHLCGQGEVQLPQGRSLQLLTPEEAMDPSSSNHRSLEHMVAVLGDAYGPYVYRHVEVSDYGVLLRSKQAAADAAAAAAADQGQGSLTRMVSDQDAKLLASGPAAAGCVSAATLDVYGRDLAKLDLLVTREEVQRQGHGKALVAGVEDMLAALGIAALVVVLDKTGQRDNKQVWPRLFKGYKRLNGRQVGALRDTFPHFQAYDRQDTMFLRRNLPDKRPQEAKEKAAERERRAKQKGREGEGNAGGRAGWVGGMWRGLGKALGGGRW